MVVMPLLFGNTRVRGRTFSHGVTLHLGLQSTTLQNCCVMGGGCGQKASSTLRTFPLPCRTSWMQFTERVWSANVKRRLTHFKDGAQSVSFFRRLTLKSSFFPISPSIIFHLSVPVCRHRKDGSNHRSPRRSSAVGKDGHCTSALGCRVVEGDGS